MTEFSRTINMVLGAIFGLALALLVFGNLGPLTQAIQGSASATETFFRTFKNT